MKLIRLKFLFPIGVFFVFVIGLVTVVTLFAPSNESGKKSEPEIGGMNLSPEVLAHRAMVEKYCREFGIPDYVDYILAIMQVESGGKGGDVLQSSESLGLPPNTLDVEASIKQGVKYFSQLLASANAKGCDINTVIQSYNMGGSFIDFVANRGKKYSYELAEEFARQKSGGVKVKYSNPIAIERNGGWRYRYGNQHYVPLVLQYLVPVQFDDEIVQTIMNEALKYQGWRYVFGGASPTTSFDCSGLTQWCYGVAGITLPRTAQMQYDATLHIALKDAVAGDLVFFHSTYNTPNYITHVGIYLGGNRMYHAGDPIGYENIDTPYWRSKLVGAGRVTK